MVFPELLAADTDIRQQIQSMLSASTTPTTDPTELQLASNGFPSQRLAMAAAYISCDIPDGTAPDFTQQPSIRARYGTPPPPTMPPIFHTFTPRTPLLNPTFSPAHLFPGTSHPDFMFEIIYPSDEVN